MARPRPDQPAAHLSGDRAPAGANVLLVTGGEPSWARWIEQRSISPDALSVADAAAMHRALHAVECVVVDAECADPLAVARRIHGADPSLQVIAVVEPEGRRLLERALLFAPGIGELWLASPSDVGGALTDRAAGVTRQRRKFERVRARVEQERFTESPQRTERALISDAYLAGLLAVLPDAIFSVDGAGRILSANPGASALLGRDARDLIGQSLADILAVGNGRDIRRLVGPGAASEERAEVHFRHPGDRPGVAELTVIPVVAGATRVWAVVLHDITEREQTRKQLEEQAAELEQQVEEMQVMAEELMQTDEERQHALEAAETARALAEEANRSKSEFLSTMSHEIRTPINAIVGYAQLLEMGLAGPLTPDQRSQLDRIATSGRHLLALINDILDLAKVESGRLIVASKPGDAVSSVEAALDLVRPQASAKGVSLERKCDDRSDASYTGDAQRVQQILVNLLSNAVKFTPAGGHVTVHCGVTGRASDAPGLDDGPWTFIRVEDTGIGISEEAMSRLFEPFFQADSGYTRAHGGTGLGLSISRRLARLMGGELTVWSRAGEGSRFTLWLPRPAER